MYTNGEYSANRRNMKYYSRIEEIRYPDEAWYVGGNSEIEASVWTVKEGQGRNVGMEYLDLRRVKDLDSDNPKKLKTFRRSDIRAFFLGLAEHCARLSEKSDLDDEERDAFAQLAEGTVALLEETPNPGASKRKLRRKKRTRKS